MEQKYVLWWQDKQVGTSGLVKSIQPALGKLESTLDISKAKLYTQSTIGKDIQKLTRLNSNLNIVAVVASANKIVYQVQPQQVWELTKTVEYSLLYDTKFKTECSEDIEYNAILMLNPDNGLIGWYKSYDKKTGDIIVAPRLKDAKLFRTSLSYSNTANDLRTKTKYRLIPLSLY